MKNPFVLSIPQIFSSVTSARTRTYGWLYLGLIPVFALLYLIGMPNHFYHATVQYEAYIDELDDPILAEIKSSIVQRFITHHGSSTAESNSWEISAYEIELLNLRSGLDMTSFKVRVPLRGQNKIVPKLTAAVITISIPNVYFLATASTGYADSVDNILYSPMQIDYETGVKIGNSILFPHDSNRKSYDDGKTYYLPLSRELQKKITNFARISNGFPYPSDKSDEYGAYAWVDWRSFMRMMYFSAVTITTKGYGDIVPITKRSRTTVAIESVLGLILMGLFVNSLFKKINGMKRDDGTEKSLREP